MICTQCGTSSGGDIWKYCPECGGKFETSKTPEPLKDMDFSGLITQAKGYMESIADGTYYEDGDDEHYMFEATMEAVYGKDIWKYINAKYLIEEEK